MDQSPLSRLGEGIPQDPRKRGAADCLGELSGAQPWPGRSWGAPAGVRCEPPPDPSGAVPAGLPAPEAAVTRLFFPRQGRGRGEGESPKAATLGVRGARGPRAKFSSSAWEAHVCACEGREPGRPAARGRRGLAPEGVLVFPGRLGGDSWLRLPGRGRIRPRGVQPLPRPPPTNKRFSNAPPPAPGMARAP